MVKGATDDYSALADLLESIGHFLNRLQIYIEIPPTEAMNEMVVKILVELLSTLALTTKETKQGKLSKSIINLGIYCVTYERRKNCSEARWREEHSGNGPEAGQIDA